MFCKNKPALCDWSDLPTRAQVLRTDTESGDRPAKVIYIFDPARSSAIPAGGASPEQRVRAFQDGRIAQIFVRYTDTSQGILCRVLAMVLDPSVGYWRYRYTTSQGGGYDLLAAALDGCPLPAVGLTLGDHCDPAGDPTLDDLRARGLVVLGK